MARRRSTFWAYVAYAPIIVVASRARGKRGYY